MQNANGFNKETYIKYNAINCFKFVIQIITFIQTLNVLKEERKTTRKTKG